MTTLQIRLFGAFSVQHGGRALPGLEAGKIQELFGYLLLHQAQAHSREALASLLWGDAPIAQARKYLRQALWQLQRALHAHATPDTPPILLIETSLVRLNGTADLWLDVAAFEQACTSAHSPPGALLTVDGARLLQNALALYRGDLLAGWYTDWCLFERERLHGLYLGALAKLMHYCEAYHDYETGVMYGNSILHHDRACERTHRRLMRLYYLAGDRTAALRQYARCVAALDEELGVGAARATTKLYEQIQADCLGAAEIPYASAATVDSVRSARRGAASLDDLLGRLGQLQLHLTAIESQIVQHIQEIERRRWHIAADEGSADLTDLA
jgi:DNA-binding SARP family transcriptional activator